MRWTLAALLILVGGLQAWDSGVLAAGPFIQLTVALAVVVTPLAWAVRLGSELRVASVVLAFVLLTAARMMSAVPLPTLHLAAFAPAVLVLVLRGRELLPRRLQS